MASNLKVEIIGVVYRVSDAAGGVLTMDDEERVAAFFENAGMKIEEHERQRIDGTHVVSIDVQ